MNPGFQVINMLSADISEEVTVIFLLIICARADSHAVLSSDLAMIEII